MNKYKNNKTRETIQRGRKTITEEGKKNRTDKPLNK